MDPITLTILTAISTGVLDGTTRVAGQAVVDMYSALKDLIKKKYGEESDVVKAVNSLEEKPASVGRQTIVKEEIAAAKASNDPELLQLSAQLLDMLKTRNPSINFTGDGNNIFTIKQNGGTNIGTAGDVTLTNNENQGS